MRSVRTTLQILEAVADNQPIGVSEVARLLGLPKSTVQRSLATLADLDWVRPEGLNGTRLVLGDRVRALSEKFDTLGALRDVAVPIMEELNRETSESVYLAVPEKGMARLVERQDSHHELRLIKAIGSREVLHAGAAGKAILAHFPESEISHYLAGGLRSVTSSTITDPAKLREELQKITENGYAIGENELTEGIVSVAAAVCPDGDRPIASITIAGPSTRVTPDKYDTYSKLVRDAALKLASALRDR